MALHFRTALNNRFQAIILQTWFVPQPARVDDTRPFLVATIHIGFTGLHRSKICLTGSSSRFTRKQRAS